MNILITGANGQLGNEMRVLSTEQYTGYTYYFTDVKELDICDEQAVMNFFKNHRVDLVVNCAAFTAVDKAEEKDNRILCDKLNRLAPGYLGRAAQQTGAGLIQISTDYVFNGESFTPYNEEDETRPASIYGATKLAGEINAMSVCDKCVVIRTAWLYSAFGNNFVKTMIRRGRECSEMGVVFDQIGSPTYARDLARAIYAIIEKGLIPGIYHFTDEGVCSWYDFAKAIHRIAGITTCNIKPLHTEEYLTPAKRPPYSVLDKTKIKSTFCIEIPQWEDSLRDCIDRLKVKDEQKQME